MGRANIAVYNWERLPVVTVDVSQVLSPGDRYEVRCAQNFFGKPVLSGTYDGNPLPLPMSDLAASPPAGAPTPPLTGPEFNAFILLTDSRGGRHQSSGAARSIVLRTARPPKVLTLFPAPPAPQD